MDKFMTLGEVARRLGVPQHKILYLLTSMKAREPSRVGGRRVWTNEEVNELAAIIENENKRKSK